MKRVKKVKRFKRLKRLKRVKRVKSLKRLKRSKRVKRFKRLFSNGKANLLCGKVTFRDYYNPKNEFSNSSQRARPVTKKCNPLKISAGQLARNSATKNADYSS